MHFRTIYEKKIEKKNEKKKLVSFSLKGSKTFSFRIVQILTICQTSGPDVMSSRALYITVGSSRDRPRILQGIPSR